MAIRKWGVRPDYLFRSGDVEVAAVSQDALVKALYDAAIVLDREGGFISVSTGRAHTDLEGEMVTTGAVVEWKDRTDARPQPEKQSAVTEPPLALVEDEPADDYDPEPGEVEVDERDVPPALRETHG